MFRVHGYKRKIVFSLFIRCQCVRCVCVVVYKWLDTANLLVYQQRVPTEKIICAIAIARARADIPMVKFYIQQPIRLLRLFYNAHDELSECCLFTKCVCVCVCAYIFFILHRCSITQTFYCVYSDESRACHMPWQSSQPQSKNDADIDTLVDGSLCVFCAAHCMLLAGSVS